MKSPWVVLLLVYLISPPLLLLLTESKSADPYKVLGVERNASQREIQKAFHKLSLQYHPDKNKSKGAQEKFSEINNAYDILSDEEKRKNYDMYGDEKGGPNFDAHTPGSHRRYTNFAGGGPGHSHFSFDPNEWQTTGSHGNSESFSFSFGNSGSGGNSFGFGLNDIFSNFFGGGGSQFDGFGGSSRSQSRTGRSNVINIQTVNSLVFKKEIVDQGMTWLLLSYVPSSKGYHVLESIVEEVAGQLHGALKAGAVNCQKEQSLCSEIGLNPSRSARVFIYSYKTGSKGSLVEYSGDWDAKSLKSFCQENFPRISKRVDVGRFDFSSSNVENLPQVLLLSTKKDTPVIWRALSGLYRRRIIFYDAEVVDTSDPAIKKLGVEALPAIVGWLSNGEKHILRTGISVKDLKSAIVELSAVLDKFENKNKKTVASQPKRSQQTESQEQQIPLLTSSNFDNVCGESTPVCVIGAFRSAKGRKKLESILDTVSKKSLTRRTNQFSTSGDSISFSLLDANKQQVFLNSLGTSGFKSSDNLLVAYKPRRGKFAAYTNELTTDVVESFISEVLSGDVQFSKTKKKPVLK